MLAVAFDTLKLARKLESAGMQPKTAQDTSAALSESFTEWLSVGNIATREDVHEVTAEVGKLDAKIARVEAKIDNVEAKLETKIEASKAEILKWLFGAIGTQTVVQLAVLYGLIHH
jgi:molecular chaperone GrpE (heat shock protein)